MEMIQLFAKWSRSCGASSTHHEEIVNEFFAGVKGVGDVLAGRWSRVLMSSSLACLLGEVQFLDRRAARCCASGVWSR